MNMVFYKITLLLLVFTLLGEMTLLNANTASAQTINATNAATMCQPVLPNLMQTDKLPGGTGRVIPVTPENIQQVLDDPETVAGDIIELSTTATYPPIHLPKKDIKGDAWIIIRTSAANPADTRYSEFPILGQRVTPNDSSLLAHIITPDGEPGIQTENGANHYWLIGLEIKPAPQLSLKQATLVAIGNYHSDFAQADHIVLDRMYIHGNADKEWGKGIILASSYTAIINSTISDIHTYTYKDASTPRYEAQAIASWNGPGPYQIKNNLLSASAQEILFGGGASCSASMVPSDIEISYNHFYKPLSWRTTSIPHWWVKNHLEFKTGRRVLIEGNYFENNWTDPSGDQDGNAIGFSPMNQVYPGNCYNAVADNPWTEVSNITFRNNQIVNAGQGMTFESEDLYGQAVQTKCIAVTNNLFYGTGDNHLLSPDGSKSGWGEGRLLLVVSGKLFGVDGLTFSHNTAFQNGPILVAGTLNDSTPDQVQPNKNFIFENNIVNRTIGNESTSRFHGIAGSGTPEGYGANEESRGVSTFNVYFKNPIFRQNIILQTDPKVIRQYRFADDHCDSTPQLNCNFFTLDPGFTDFKNGNFALKDQSPFKRKGSEFFLGQSAQDVGVSDWPALTKSSAIARGQASLSTSSQPTKILPVLAPVHLNRTLSYRQKNPDVIILQKFLNTHGYTIATRGAGSPGRETNYFGILTKVALQRFQNDYLKGKRYIVGVLDAPTRAAANKIW